MRTLIGFVGLALVAAGCAPKEPAVGDKSASLGSQDRYIVKFKDWGLGMGALKAAGADVVLELTQSNAAAAKIPAAALNGLRNNPNVAYIEPDAERYLLSQTTPYGVAMVQADLSPVLDGAGTPLPTTGRKVCIIDTGNDLGHPDLPTIGVTAALHPCDPATSSKCRLTTGNPLTDLDGHGTHVAGTIAALNNDIGVVGVMPAGSIALHIIKIFGDDGLWVTRASNLVRALEQCREAGANVVSMSLGGGAATTTERDAFAAALNAGVLSIAAAGNDGTTNLSYPASYDSVVSVAAIDANKVVASFSQKNSQVELAAPGVGVLSTIPRGYGVAVTLTVDGTAYAALGMDGSPLGSAGGALVDCGYGASTCANAAGKVCLIQRGDNISFADKVLACQNGDGVGAIIYNNTAGELAGTVAGAGTTIPSVGITQADGQYLLANRIGKTAALSIAQSGYDYAAWNGTSMATPHVSGAAALVWSYATSCTAASMRKLLGQTAMDLGAAGRDNSYGFGLVQAKAAVDSVIANGCPVLQTCTKTETTETSCADGKDNDCDGATDGADADCQSTAPLCKVPGVKCKLSTECCSLLCVKAKPTDRFGACAAMP
jgi:subtilisin family serine protease